MWSSLMRMRTVGGVDSGGALVGFAVSFSRGGGRLSLCLRPVVFRAVMTGLFSNTSVMSTYSTRRIASVAAGGSAEDLIEFLAKHPGRTRVLAVGHEPDLSYSAARLIGANGRANLAFKKGGCCLIRFDSSPPKSPGHLMWWLTPRLLRKLR